MNACQGKQLEIRVVNEIGVLNDLAKSVAEKGVNILAMHGYTEGAEGILHLVTDDNLRAGDALRARNYNPVQTEVVLVEVPHKPGMLEAVSQRLAKAGIDIHHLAATGAVGTDRVLIVFSSSNNDQAVVVLSKE